MTTVGGDLSARGPAHVGLIPDGLRRWANLHHETFAESYMLGAHKVIEILLALQRNGVRTVTVYNLSRANLKRSEAELSGVYAASVHFFATLIPANFDPAVCSVRLHGNRDLLPAHYLAAAGTAESAMTGAGFRINILAAYDAGDELRAAHQRALREGCDITAAFDIGAVDMVIRSTPEPLLSGFLPMQSQYAQLNFLTTPLNEVHQRHIDALVAVYRRSPQLHGR
ncbi:undecaprenyl diphosphate synthase family protein [Mycolicibacterium hippocampi]|uniref:undecaprenyl diphosphate synthase family protein n=1 Tax=Mycolicibacterium hippocampi TaxID=659824 RepID=UPI003515C116